MLGCHDFCGYYEWTFHYVRRRFGQEAVAKLWAEAIGGESQAHYTEAARQAGLAGLYRTWVKTGEDESCDWTFTLDEARNVLRWDMRRCPSRGFLQENDLAADEDYCDHCMGWMIPLLAQVGVEVAEHEHNHCGQCWGTMRMAGRPSQELSVDGDIRDDPRWRGGHYDRWCDGVKLPIAHWPVHAVDPCEAILNWFAGAKRLAVLADDTVETVGWVERSEPHQEHAKTPVVGLAPLDPPYNVAGLMTDRVFLRQGSCGLAPLAVLIDHAGFDRSSLSSLWHNLSEAERPLLLYTHFSRAAPMDPGDDDFPRPLPLLPLLIRSGRYMHQPGEPLPSAASLVRLAGEVLAEQLALEHLPPPR